MSKQITTRWYITAWVVWLITFVAAILVARGANGGSVPSLSVLLYLVAAVAGIVILVTWIGALVKLGMQHSWGWFVVVLILQLVGLGIIGMIAYAVAGPEDTGAPVMRPTVT